jgi:stage V sporulation protein SpoVS
MIVTTRVSDDLAAEIDRLAIAQGQTRAAWLALAIARAALTPENRDVPVMAVQSRGDPDDQVRVTVRLDRREIEAIDTVRAPLGLTRNEWIKRTLRWQLWDKAGALRLATISQVELGKLRKQVLGIGRNINQAVHAMNAANQPESSLDVARIAGPFIETCAELKTLLFSMRRSLSSYVGAEVGYWTGTAKGMDE